MFRITSSILACTNTNCDNVCSKIDLVEKKLLQGLDIWLKDYESEINSIDLLKSNENDIINLKKEALQKVSKNLVDCNSKLEKIYDFLENGTYTLDVFTERKNKILKEQKNLTIQYNSITNELNELEKNEKAKKELIPQTKNVLKEYLKCNDPKKKNDLLKSVIKKVDYLKTKKCYGKSSNPEDFELLIYPKF